MSLQAAADALDSARERVAIEAVYELSKLLKTVGLGVHGEGKYYRGLEKLTQILIDEGWV